MGNKHFACSLLFFLTFHFLGSFTGVHAQCGLLDEDFSTTPVLSATDTDGAWYPDRYPPAAFTDDAGRLKISIDGPGDGVAGRPAGFASGFYNTQGPVQPLRRLRYDVLRRTLHPR
ncbi:MAG: hypothetical protein R3B47_13010 [Bacteroidia bacterium]